MKWKCSHYSKKFLVCACTETARLCSVWGLYCFIAFCFSALFSFVLLIVKSTFYWIWTERQLWSSVTWTLFCIHWMCKIVPSTLAAVNIFFSVIFPSSFCFNLLPFFVCRQIFGQRHEFPLETRQSNYISKRLWRRVFPLAEVRCFIFARPRAPHHQLRWRRSLFGTSRNKTFAWSKELPVGELFAINAVRVDVVGKFCCCAWNRSRTNGFAGHHIAFARHNVRHRSK